MQLLSTYQNSAESLYNKVKTFSGAKNSKEYVHLEEQLTALLILVDSVEVSEHVGIRRARKCAVCSIQGSLAILEQT